jgi:glycosyltransferase involved in cell wall biosynthesis
LIVVDDHSSDGSWEILQQLSSLDDRINLVRHDHNRGKGAAIRTAVERATGDICIVHDADLEYCPDDIPSLLVPFARESPETIPARELRNGHPHHRRAQSRPLTAVGSWLTDLILRFGNLLQSDQCDASEVYSASQ